MSSRRVFTREFKLAAIKKIIEQGLTFVEAAREMSCIPRQRNVYYEYIDQDPGDCDDTPAPTLTRPLHVLA